MSVIADAFIAVPEKSQARTHSSRQLHAAAVRLLWTYLRDYRLNGVKFRHQHLLDTYLADFVCLDSKLVIEIENEFSPALTEHAEKRRASFAEKGFQMLRFNDREVITDTRAVLMAIRAALSNQH